MADITALASIGDLLKEYRFKVPGYRREHVQRGGTFDSGWQSHTINAADLVRSHNTVTVRLSVLDWWTKDRNQTAYWDNFYAGASPPPSSEVSGTSEMPLNICQQIARHIDIHGEYDAFVQYDRDGTREALYVVLGNYNSGLVSGGAAGR